MAPISKAQIKFIRSLQHKKFRDEAGMFVAEGSKCVEELKKGFELVLEVTPNNASETEIAQMSGLKTPQGVIAVFKKHITNDKSQIANGELVLALDGIQDPGNLGTIIRTCDWFGVHQIICSSDTADCYNPKVVQATMGSLTRVNLTYTDLPQWLAQQQCPIYGTLLNGKNIYQSKIENQESRIIVMGNEGNGISQAVRELITHPILIPSYPENAETSESLNVAIATAIVLAEFRRLG
ncbi:MAG: RNA methyltransferase [Paludibacteraceae bacterium]|nr:RNA methyltransferase [Paludibacteraceae bacterium]